MTFDLQRSSQQRYQDGWEQLQVVLLYSMGLHAVGDDRPARVRHGKDSTHPQQESGHHEPASSAGDCRLYYWVRNHVTFLPNQ